MNLFRHYHHQNMVYLSTIETFGSKSSLLSTCFKGLIRYKNRTSTLLFIYIDVKNEALQHSETPREYGTLFQPLTRILLLN